MSSKLLSICTTVKNRSLVVVDGHELRLFPNCIRSIVAAIGAATDIELVVSDWESDDWPLAKWLPEAAHPIPVRIVTLRGTFSRGRGLNAAADAASGEYLFFIDSDALISENVLARGIQTVQQGKAYFPILYSFNDPEHQTGRWRHSGFGHCILSKQAFERIGGWPEYSSWGREDDHFWARANELLSVVREQVDGFYHQWHPDDIDFKNRFGAETDTVREVRARAEHIEKEIRTVERLRALFPRGTCYVLVDQDQTDIKEGVDGRAVPFLEHDGEYWGPPIDDMQAISELERLHRDGAEFIVFPWLAFWWLEHYGGFAKHLEKTASCLGKDELIAVYALHPRSRASIAR